MKLLVSALAGTIIACSIFGALIISRPEIERILESPSIPPGTKLSDIAVVLSVLGTTQPRGIGSLIYLALNVTARISLSDVTLRIDVSKASQDWNSSGIELQNATTSWKVDLAANTSIVWDLTINAKEIGYGMLRVEALEPGSEPRASVVGEPGPTDSLGILVQQDEILVFEDLNGALPLILPSDLDPLLPIKPVQPGNVTLTWPPE